MNRGKTELSGGKDLNILLVAVNAKYIHSNLAVYSLKASAGEYGEQVELAEFTINHQTDDIFRAIYQKRPDLLFFSCYIWNRSVIVELAENLRRVLPKTVIWAGGPEVSYDAEAFLREQEAFDGVMCGEGEKSFFQVLQHYVGGCRALEEIPGIVYRMHGVLRGENGRTDHAVHEARNGKPETVKCRAEGVEKEQITRTQGVQELVRMDELPFVYQNPADFSNRIIYYESSRGCPYSCSYCLSSIDKSVRFRSTELVKQELGYLLEQRVPQVKFVDRTFNCSHKHATEIWRFLQEHDNGVTNFHFEIAADILTEEELALLSGMRPGLVQFEIGVQTTNKQSLDAIHRTASFERIADRVQKISACHNIHQHLDLIAGLPYEDFASFQDSFDDVYSLKPQELQLGFLKVLRGSEMHARAAEYGIVYRSRPPYEVLETRWISCAELLRLKEVEEMLEVYYNSQQFRYTIRALERLFERPFAMYEALADYYKEQNAEGKSFSRMQRYTLLRGFIGQTAGADVQYFDELLTLDFYLRENAKSRPDWAEHSEEYGEQTIHFYQQGVRQYLPEAVYGAYTWKQVMRMTHLEHFTYNVTGDGRKKGTWLLFDYAQRDVLTGDAAVKEIML